MLLLALPPVFYVWSMHSSGTPIFVPDLWPFSWYNTRYALAVLPLAAFCAGAGRVSQALGRANASPIVIVDWQRRRSSPERGLAICWKESEVNSAGPPRTGPARPPRF